MIHVLDQVDENSDVDSPPKKGKSGFLIGLVLALAMGAGGFYAGSSGLVSFSDAPEMEEDANGKAKEYGKEEPAELPYVAFVEIEPVLIALARESERRHLRFRGHLEVDGNYKDDVVHLMPRILDILNSYLRAIEIRQLEDPAGLSRLRAQMLRRVQIVTGEGRVRDLLISEFVLN